MMYDSQQSKERGRALDFLPSSLSEVTMRDAAWIIAGMLLAYLATTL